MKLYNVTYNLGDTSTTLIPKVPDSAGDDEDRTTPRVCLADSLEHCLQAFGSHYRNLNKGARILIREVDVDENDAYLRKPLYLKETGKVLDALENNEYWYLKPIECIVRKAEIIDADTEFTIGWTCVPIEECRKIISMYSPVDVNEYDNSEELYYAFIRWAEVNKKWNEEDTVWDEIVDRNPWARKTEIQKVEVRYL